MPLPEQKKFRRVLDFNRKALDLLGLWPIDPLASTWGRRWRRFIPSFVLCRLACSLAVQAISITKAWGNTELAAEGAIMFIAYTHTGVKFFTLYWHRARVRRVFERVDQLNVDLVGVSRDNVALLRDTDTLCDRIIKYPAAGVVGLAIVCALVLFPYCLFKRKIIFFLWFPHDITTSPSFEITLFVVGLFVILDVYITSMCDLCLIVPIMQVAGQLQMLSRDIGHSKLVGDHNLKTKNHRDCSSFPMAVKSKERNSIPERMEQLGLVEKYLDQLEERKRVESRSGQSKCSPEVSDIELVEMGAEGSSLKCIPEGREIECAAAGSNSKCIPEGSEMKRDFTGKLAFIREEMNAMKMTNATMSVNIGHHQKIINLVQEMQSIFNAILAEQILFNGLMGVMGLYVGTLAEKANPKILATISFIIAGLVEFFFICLSCDRLSITSMRVFDAAYESDWLEASESFKRSLRLLMTRAQKHLAIKAAGVPLSRRTFRAVCKVAYYLQSLLNKIYTKTVA